MDDALKGMEFPFACPKCSKRFKKTLAWLHSHDEFRCPCGTTFKTAGLKPGIDEASGALGDIRKQLAKLFK